MMSEDKDLRAERLRRDRRVSPSSRSVYRPRIVWIVRTCHACRRRLVHTKRGHKGIWVCSRCKQMAPAARDAVGRHARRAKSDIISVAPLPSPRVGIRVKWNRPMNFHQAGRRLSRAAKIECMHNINKWVMELTYVL